MGATKVNRKEKVDKEQDSHKGTWISLGMVGAVILITYFVLFGLFMDRV
jgi:hypothetical protein